MKPPNEEISSVKIASIVLRLVLGLLAAIAAPLFAEIGYLPLGVMWASLAAYCLISVFFDLYKLSSSEEEADNSDAENQKTELSPPESDSQANYI